MRFDGCWREGTRHGFAGTRLSEYSPASLALVLRVYVTRLNIERQGEETPGAVVALGNQGRGNGNLGVESEVARAVSEGAAKGLEGRDIALPERRE